jgi:hypothetical protein
MNQDMHHNPLSSSPSATTKALQLLGAVALPPKPGPPGPPVPVPVDGICVPSGRATLLKNPVDSISASTYEIYGNAAQRDAKTDKFGANTYTCPAGALFDIDNTRRDVYCDHVTSCTASFSPTQCTGNQSTSVLCDWKST